MCVRLVYRFSCQSKNYKLREPQLTLESHRTDSLHCLPVDSSSSKTASCSTMQRARRETLRATGTSTSTPRWAAPSKVAVTESMLLFTESSRHTMVYAACVCCRAWSLWEAVWSQLMKTWACPSPSWSTWRTSVWGTKHITPFIPLSFISPSDVLFLLCLYKTTQVLSETESINKRRKHKTEKHIVLHLQPGCGICHQITNPTTSKLQTGHWATDQLTEPNTLCSNFPFIRINVTDPSNPTMGWILTARRDPTVQHLTFIFCAVQTWKCSDWAAHYWWAGD